MKESIELAQLLVEWHENKINQLDLVIDKKDSNVVIGDMTIVAGTDLHRGLLIGFMLAREQVKDLPFSLSDKEEE